MHFPYCQQIPWENQTYNVLFGLSILSHFPCLSVALSSSIRSYTRKWKYSCTLKFEIIQPKFTNFQMFALYKSNKNYFNSSRLTMWHVVPPNSTEKCNFYRLLQFQNYSTPSWQLSSVVEHLLLLWPAAKIIHSQTPSSGGAHSSWTMASSSQQFSWVCVLHQQCLKLKLHWLLPLNIAAGLLQSLQGFSPMHPEIWMQHWLTSFFGQVQMELKISTL